MARKQSNPDADQEVKLKGEVLEFMIIGVEVTA